MLEFLPAQPRDLVEAWDRIKRLVASVLDVQLIRAQTLVTGSAGNLVAHGLKRPPKGAVAQVVGVGASTAVITIGAIDDAFVKVYVTANCTADIRLDV
jgi:hypothetical protein